LALVGDGCAVLHAKVMAYLQLGKSQISGVCMHVKAYLPEAENECSTSNEKKVRVTIYPKHTKLYIVPPFHLIFL
jgi:hypothetical protein